MGLGQLPPAMTAVLPQGLCSIVRPRRMIPARHAPCLLLPAAARVAPGSRLSHGRATSLSGRGGRLADRSVTRLASGVLPEQAARRRCAVPDRTPRAFRHSSAEPPTPRHRRRRLQTRSVVQPTAVEPATRPPSARARKQRAHRLRAALTAGDRGRRRPGTPANASKQD